MSPSQQQALSVMTTRLNDHYSSRNVESNNMKKKQFSKLRSSRRRIPAATTYEQLEPSPSIPTNNLSFMIQSPSRDRVTPNYFRQSNGLPKHHGSKRVVPSPLLLEEERAFLYGDGVRCARGQLPESWLSLGRTNRLEERWKLQSQLAGPHSQPMETLDFSNRAMGSLEALEYGVLPQIASCITTLKYPALDCSLPQFLNRVTQLFPRLQHLHLATTTAPITHKKEPYEGDGEVMAADAYLSDDDDLMHELLDQPTLRLYIIFRLPDLISFNDICITPEERELARPSIPSGHKVDKNNWYSVSQYLTPYDDDDDDATTVIHSNHSSQRTLDYSPTTPTACPTTPNRYPKTPPPPPPEEEMVLSPSSANQMYSPSRRVRQPLEERAPTSPLPPYINDENRHPPQLYLQPRQHKSPFPINFRPSHRTPNTRPPPSPASTPRTIPTPRPKYKLSDRVTSIPQTTTSMLDNLDEDDDEDEEEENIIP